MMLLKKAAWNKQNPFQIYFFLRPILKSCLFPIHRLGEIKNSHELPANRNIFLQSLCLKRYTIKRFKKISSWYNKNVTLYIYIQFLCSIFMLIHRNLIMIILSIKVLSGVPIQIKQSNISIFSPIFSFADSLWFAAPHSRLIKKMQWRTWALFFD